MYIKLLNFNNICNTFVGYVLFTLGVITVLPALIHARLHGCARSSCPEQNHTANTNCMLIGVRCVLFGTRFGFGRVLFRCVLLHAARFPAASLSLVLSCSVWHAACVFHWLRQGRCWPNGCPKQDCIAVPPSSNIMEVKK